jgi:hypothetical protein
VLQRIILLIPGPKVIVEKWNDVPSGVKSVPGPLESTDASFITFTTKSQMIQPVPVLGSRPNMRTGKSPAMSRNEKLLVAQF